MSSRRQPLMTLSPSQGTDYLSSPSPKHRAPPPQVTPKLPRRERLDSLSRLLKNRNFSEWSEKRPTGSKPPPVRILLEPPRSPSQDSGDQLHIDHKFLSPQQLHFSPSSPARSPLYSPDTNTTFLGRGSFGKVALCHYKGKPIAVKILHGESSTIGERHLLPIRHPHLVQVYHVSEWLDGTRLVFMDFAGHCNLQQVLDTKSELDLRRKLSFCVQTVKGLDHCHRNGIVHGDVKPANVIVSPRGVCKLGDFGHSFHVTSSQTRASRDLVGTAAYAAPEVLKGGSPGKPSDVFSLGVFLWQVHSREMPFAGEHPHVIIYKVVHYSSRPRFPAHSDPLLSSYATVAESCWRTQPSQRPTTHQALASLEDIVLRVKARN